MAFASTWWGRCRSAGAGQGGSRWSPRRGSGEILDPCFRRPRIGGAGPQEAFGLPSQPRGAAFAREGRAVAFVSFLRGLARGATPLGLWSRAADGPGRELGLLWVWSHRVRSIPCSLTWRAKAPSAGVRGSVRSTCGTRSGATWDGALVLTGSPPGPSSILVGWITVGAWRTLDVGSGTPRSPPGPSGGGKGRI